jgi:hypothetical protein
MMSYDTIFLVIRKKNGIGGSKLKTVYAATQGQKDYIHSLIEQFYTNIFPNYFTDQEIFNLENLGVLSFNPDVYHGTLKEAFSIISSLQALMAIIESLPSGNIPMDYRTLFERNVALLEKHGLSFPITIDHFKHKKDAYVSIYTKPIYSWVM